MPRDVLINAGAGEVRVAVMEDGVLEQLWLERTVGFEEMPGRKRGHASRILATMNSTRIFVLANTSTSLAFLI